MVVIDALCILTEPNHAGVMELTVNINHIAVDRHNRDELACPISFLNHTCASHKAHLDLLNLNLAFTDDGDAVSQESLKVLNLILELGNPVGQKHKGFLLVVLVPILGNRYGIVINPMVLVVVCALEVRHLIFGKLLLKVILRDVGHHESIVGIAPVKLLGSRVEVNSERVCHLNDTDVLVEGVIRAVFGSQSPHTKATSNSPLKCGVIGLLCIADRFDVTNQTLHNLGKVLVVFLCGTKFNRRAVLPLVAGNLANVLPKSVELVAWSGLALALLVVIPLLALNGHESHIINGTVTVVAVGL